MSLSENNKGADRWPHLAWLLNLLERLLTLLAGLLTDRAFMAALVVMAVAAIGWRTAVAKLGIVLAKQPVPWPAHVMEVDSGYRNRSFPTEFGHYRRLEEDGVLSPKDGQSDGETVIKDDELEILGMGTSRDKQLIGERKSNWYVSRIYEDIREPANSPYRYWKMTLTYYTGGLNTVPHIPEVCMQAGGAIIHDGGGMDVNVADGTAPWKGTLRFHRVPYDLASRPFFLYYIFSINGQPEESREMVRLKLMDLRKKYTYFAKLEVGPLLPAFDGDEADNKTREFIRQILPMMTKDLPMPADLEALESADKSKQ